MITLPDGSQMALDSVPLDSNQLIETSGVNGYTHALANGIHHLASKLQNQGVLNPEQFNAIICTCPAIQ